MLLSSQSSLLPLGAIAPPKVFSRRTLLGIFSVAESSVTISADRGCADEYLRYVRCLPHRRHQSVNRLNAAGRLSAHAVFCLPPRKERATRQMHHAVCAIEVSSPGTRRFRRLPGDICGGIRQFCARSIGIAREDDNGIAPLLQRGAERAADQTRRSG